MLNARIPPAKVPRDDHVAPRGRRAEFPSRIIRVAVYESVSQFLTFTKVFSRPREGKGNRLRTAIYSATVEIYDSRAARPSH